MALEGEHGASLVAAREGLKVQDETGYGWWDAELHRLEGIALLGLSDLTRANVPSKRRCVLRNGSTPRPMNCAPR